MMEDKKDNQKKIFKLLEKKIKTQKLFFKSSYTQFPFLQKVTFNIGYIPI
uniref:Uncharacterized protein n=1 Tax=viral metagenome TaxID=1070528 RepID=A0A6C0H342_9ZZZZ